MSRAFRLLGIWDASLVSLAHLIKTAAILFLDYFEILGLFGVYGIFLVPGVFDEIFGDRS